MNILNYNQLLGQFFTKACSLALKGNKHEQVLYALNTFFPNVFETNFEPKHYFIVFKLFVFMLHYYVTKFCILNALK